MTIASGLRASAARTPHKTAMRQGDQKRSYSEVVRNVNRAANLLLENFGLKTGDVAAIVSQNSMDYLEIVAAISDIGAIAATPNPKLAPRELADILNDCGAKLVFLHADCEDRLDLSLLDGTPLVIQLGAPYEALGARASDRYTPPPIAEWATFAIPYTSGTTGKPKGVMLPHRSRALGFLAYAAEYGIYSPDDYFLAISPMCHGAGFAYAFASLFLGGTVEIMDKFDPEAVLRAIHSGRVTGLFTVPTHYHGIFSLEDRLLASLRGNRLKGIVANAAPLSQDAKAQIIDYFGDGLLNETYGSTEAGVVTNLRPRDQLRKTRCVGQAFVGNEIRLVKTDGSEAGPGEVGELFSTSPYLFNGYWGKPAQTAEVFDKDGLVSVGDLAARDDEGFIYIVDRKKDMVITGGMNVYPKEIERTLDEHAAVLESAVIGVPDPQWGEKLAAYVVFQDGRGASVDELTEFCKARLAPYKLPKSFATLAALPRNANGKVLKTILRDLHAG
jgi:long-chain acyl-CoA synthetase